MVEVSGEVRVTATVSVWICWSHCDVPLGTPLRRPYSRSLVQPLRLARCPTHSEDIGNAQSSHSRRKIRTEQPTAASERSTMPWPDSTHTGSRERRSFCTGCRPSEPPRYSRRSPLSCPVRQTDRAVHAAGALSTCHAPIQAPQRNGAVFLRRRYTTGT
jgi:hypothetical protein